MAGVRIILRKIFIRGSIIEPVVAIVILVLAMAMAFTILTRTNITPTIQAKNMAAEIISIERFNCLMNADFLNKEEQYDAFKLIKEVKEINKGKNAEIALSVYDKKDNLIKEELFIVAIEEPNND